MVNVISAICKPKWNPGAACKPIANINMCVLHACVCVYACVTAAGEAGFEFGSTKFIFSICVRMALPSALCVCECVCVHMCVCVCVCVWANVFVY